MASLPRSYVKVVRDITGYWGAFPVGQQLAPGMVGRKENGTFVRETWLADLAGYDPTKFAAPAPHEKVSTDAWVGSGVRLDRIDVGAGGGALPAGARFRLSFSGANQGAVACIGLREWSFENPRLVKDHLIELYRAGLWGPRDILVMSVMLVDKAWVMISSDRGQSVELSLSGLPVPNGAAELLKAVLGAGTVDIAHSATVSVGYSAELVNGGSPLFQAIRIKKFPRIDTRYVKGPNSVFAEPDFGGTDDETADRNFACGGCREFRYDEAAGDPARSIPKGARWEDIPSDWSCPICGAQKASFTVAPSG